MSQPKLIVFPGGFGEISVPAMVLDGDAGPPAPEPTESTELTTLDANVKPPVKPPVEPLVPNPANSADPADSTEPFPKTAVRDHLFELITRQLAESHQFAIGPDRQLYRYHEGRYVPEAKDWIDSWFSRFLRAHHAIRYWTRDLSSRISSFMAVDQPRLWPTPPVDKICFANGILDLKSGFLLPHSPQWLSTIQIPADWDPVDLPLQDQAWHYFLTSLFPADAIDYAWEVIGACLVPNRDRQDVTYLVGAGANGKSTFIEALCELVGENNVARVAVGEINDQRFSAADLQGKLLNVDTDVEIGRWKSVGPLKKITGGDGIRAENKGEKSFNFRPFCRLIFSGNELPDARDTTQGFFRRWKIVPFMANFGKSGLAQGRSSTGPSLATDQSKILQALLSPAQRSHALQLAVAALRRLQQGSPAPIPASIARASQEFELLRDPLYEFITKFCAELPPQPTGTGGRVAQPGYFKTQAALYEAYVKWCRDGKVRAPRTTHDLTKWINAHASAAFVPYRPAKTAANPDRPRGWQIWPHLLPTIDGFSGQGAGPGTEAGDSSTSIDDVG